MKDVNLKKLLSKWGLTQRQAAKLLTCSTQTVSNIICGRAELTPARAFQVSTIAKMEDVARADYIRKVIGEEPGTKKTGVLETAGLAHVLMKKLMLDRDEAFAVAYHYLRGGAMPFDDKVMRESLSKAKHKKVPSVTEAQAHEMLAAYRRAAMNVKT